jgi:hypothetical protein
MRVLLRVGLCATLFLSLSAAAQSSNGDFRFALTGASGGIQYDARVQGSSGRGQITFNGALEVPNEQADGEDGGGTRVANVALNVTVDCVRVKGNRAAMSGVVTASNVPEYMGIRAMLAVEDGGEGSKAPSLDKFTWGVYRPSGMNWTPEDSEVPGDAGWVFTWYASDAERPDDTPVMTTRGSTVDCTTFGFDSYSFEDVPHGAGNIQVKP